jgi:hypothetical protein
MSVTLPGITIPQGATVAVQVEITSQVNVTA